MLGCQSKSLRLTLVPLHVYVQSSAVQEAVMNEPWAWINLSFGRPALVSRESMFCKEQTIFLVHNVYYTS